jgi:hypothetical protein
MSAPSAPRFVLAFDVQLGDASYGQTVILTIASRCATSCAPSSRPI